MVEDGALNIYYEASITVVAGTVMAVVGIHNIFHGSIINVVGWHGYGRGRDL